MNSYQNLLYKSIRIGDISIVEGLILSNKVNLLYENNKAINMAINYKHVNIVNLLLNNKKVFNSINLFDLLINAILNNSIQIVKYFIMIGINPHDFKLDKKLPIIIASEIGNLDIVNLLLLDSRVDPSVLDNYAYKIAIQNKHYSIANRIYKDYRVYCKFSQAA